MSKFGVKSLERLSTCHPDLQLLFSFVVRKFDCSVLCGHRNEEDQNQAFRNNRSKVKWPDGKHNTTPSEAIDVVPYPVDWENLNRFYMFGGYVIAKAESLGIKIKWGGDWDMDTLTDDQKFQDLPHFEIIL